MHVHVCVGCHPIKVFCAHALARPGRLKSLQVSPHLWALAAILVIRAWMAGKRLGAEGVKGRM
eukprot:363522-Chlamydomonas_euryale.AAC.4